MVVVKNPNEMQWCLTAHCWWSTPMSCLTSYPRLSTTHHSLLNKLPWTYIHFKSYTFIMCCSGQASECWKKWLDGGQPVKLQITAFLSFRKNIKGGCYAHLCVLWISPSSTIHWSPISLLHCRTTASHHCANGTVIFLHCLVTNTCSEYLSPVVNWYAL